MTATLTKRVLAPLANVNGVRMPLSEVLVPALDRGFLFGDAIYEVIVVLGGRPFLLDEHWRRLERSLASIRIEGVDLERLRRRMEETIAAGPFKDGMVYVQITRGAAPRRAHAFPASAAPLELLWVEELVKAYEEERRAGVGVLLQPDIRWGRCDIKSTNLLANVLAHQAAREAGCAEAVLYLPDGTLTEASHSSFFGVLDGMIRTTPNNPGILPGCTRGLVLSLTAKLRLPVEQRSLHRDDLPRVSELFLTGTTSEVVPVVRIDGKPVADGKAGPVTRKLQDAYGEVVREFVAAGTKS
jgi:D-alanine transaminase